VARVYATRTDLVAYAPPDITVPEDPEATRLLTRASERVDDALLTAVYEVDSVTLLPTDSTVTEALRLATCAEAVDMIRHGSDSGDDGINQWDSISIGSVKLSGRRDTASSSGSSSGLSSEAAGHLRRAGLGGVIYT
jgi:hypothetical protein